MNTENAYNIYPLSPFTETGGRYYTARPDNFNHHLYNLTYVYGTNYPFEYIEDTGDWCIDTGINPIDLENERETEMNFEWLNTNACCYFNRAYYNNKAEYRGDTSVVDIAGGILNKADLLTILEQCEMKSNVLKSAIEGIDFDTMNVYNGLRGRYVCSIRTDSGANYDILLIRKASGYALKLISANEFYYILPNGSVTHPWVLSTTRIANSSFVINRTFDKKVVFKDFFDEDRYFEYDFKTKEMYIKDDLNDEIVSFINSIIQHETPEKIYIAKIDNVFQVITR